MRKPVLAGNWKMNKTAQEAVELVTAIRGELANVTAAEIVVCPSFLAVPDTSRLAAGTVIGVGAQDLYWKESGAYTGEVAPNMVAEFCTYVIIGHSERREYFGETDESVNLKIKAAFAHGLTPIVCVGETLALRQENKTETWVSGQVKAALEGLTAEQVASLIIAYEPIWAIGTGLAATAEDAEHVCGAVVRATVAKMCGDAVAQAVRIQYGGSVKPDNTAELMAQPNIDGALIGGASLKAADFIGIVRESIKAKGL
jgi:triosephosphate isomerase